MARFNEWFLHRRDHVALFVSVLLSTGLMVSEDAVQVRAIQVWTLDGLGYVLEKIQTVGELKGLSEENRRLRLQNSELMVENSRLYEALLENERLRALLGFKSESDLRLMPAKVIGMENTGFVNSLILAAGANDSLQRNQAVVTAKGLVGKVFRVAGSHSTAQILLDRNFRAGAMVQRSRVKGIVKWEEGNQVILAEVPKRSDVVVGDVVVTSGLSTIFPGGIEIGYVTKCIDLEDSMFMEILVQPAVDFSKLEEVFVVKSRSTTPSS